MCLWCGVCPGRATAEASWPVSPRRVLRGARPRFSSTSREDRFTPAIFVSPKEPELASDEGNRGEGVEATWTSSSRRSRNRNC